MLKRRDAQGLPINVIILAVIGLVVLVILIVMFSKKSGESIKIIESCDSRGGDCKLEKDGCGASEFKIAGVKCPDKDGEKQICCVRA